MKNSETRNRNLSSKTPTRTQQLRKELLGAWYNYESKDTSQSDHWLAGLEATLKPNTTEPAV